MNFIKCKNGHFYKEELNKCPYCPENTSSDTLTTKIFINTNTFILNDEKTLIFEETNNVFQFDIIEINERYKVKGKNLIGHGGQAKIFKAYDKLLDRDIAVKLYSVSSDETINNLKEEFKIVSKLRHRNIIGYYDFIEFYIKKQRLIAIIMDFANYGTLKNYIYETKPTIESTIDIFIQIFEGIEAIHEKNIIHHDLKPSNILLYKTKNNTLIPLISDFLLNKNKTEIIKPINADEILVDNYSSLYGTVEYMAPECYHPKTENSHFGPMTDLWSLGIIIYELFNKELPFNSRMTSSFSEIAKNVLTKVIDTSNIPFPFEKIAKLCLTKNSKERVNDVKILTEYLKKNKDTTHNYKFNDIDKELLNKIKDIKYKSEYLKKHIIEELAMLKKEFADFKAKNNASVFKKTDLYDLIKKNKIDECFKLLNKIDEVENIGIAKHFIILQSQWSDLKSKELLGLQDSETLSISHNKIRSTLIDFIDNLDI